MSTSGAVAASTSARVDSEHKVKFTALEGIAVALRVLAWLVLVLGLLGVYFTYRQMGDLGMDEPGGSAALAIFQTVGAFFAFLMLGALSEMIRLAIQIEKNTWRSAVAAERAVETYSAA